MMTRRSWRSRRRRWSEKRACLAHQSCLARGCGSSMQRDQQTTCQCTAACAPHSCACASAPTSCGRAWRLRILGCTHCGASAAVSVPAVSTTGDAARTEMRSTPTRRQSSSGGGGLCSQRGNAACCAGVRASLHGVSKRRQHTVSAHVVRTPGVPTPAHWRSLRVPLLPQRLPLRLWHGAAQRRVQPE